MSIIKNIEKHWQQEGVKFVKKGKEISWRKLLRTVDCSICEKHETEAKENIGFLNWGLLIHEMDINGKSPEVCPECMKKISGDIIPAPRFAECSKCKVRQREKIFGVGWPGWKQFIISTRQSRDIIRNLICPNCVLELAKKLGEKYIRETWTALTYAAGSLLTSTKMTQTQANFAALGAGDSGAPDIYNLESGADASKEGSPAVGDIYVATDTTEVYVCYSGGSWVKMTDHGTLNGLADDDHTQYYNAARHTALDSTIKAWIHFDGTGTIAINDSFNVTSITDNGTGNYTVTWATDFANAFYAVVTDAREQSHCKTNVIATGTCSMTVKDDSHNNADSEGCCMIAFGDQ